LAVLVADKLPLLAWFDNEPLAYPILFKTLVDTALGMQQWPEVLNNMTKA
jgi:hypothetical protein